MSASTVGIRELKAWWIHGHASNFNVPCWWIWSPKKRKWQALACMHACVLEMLATAMLSFFFVFSFLHAWHTRLLFDILPRLLLRRMLVLESCTYYFSVKRKESCTILSSEIVLRACLVTDTCTVAGTRVRLWGTKTLWARKTPRLGSIGGLLECMPEAGMAWQMAGRHVGACAPAWMAGKMHVLFILVWQF